MLHLNPVLILHAIHRFIVISAKDEVPLVPRVVIDRPSFNHEAAVCDPQANKVFPTDLSLNDSLHTAYLGETELGEGDWLALQLQFE